MTDKNWMLNPTAIRHAKECIHVVKQELGIKLTLSHPNFMHMLQEYEDMLDSDALSEAYGHLVQMANGVVAPAKRSSDKVIRMPFAKTEEPEDDFESEAVPTLSERLKASFKHATSNEEDIPLDSIVNDDETVVIRGKSYAKFRDGKEFKGIYRGQPKYG